MATEQGRRGLMLSLVSAVAQDYFELEELDGRLGIARDSTGSFESTYALFNRRYGASISSRLAVTRAESALAEASGTVAISSVKSQSRNTRSAPCWEEIRDQYGAIRQTRIRGFRRLSRPGCHPRYWSGVLICSKQSSILSRPRRVSASPEPSFFRGSA
jgi:hypothetical protein